MDLRSGGGHTCIVLPLRIMHLGGQFLVLACCMRQVAKWIPKLAVMKMFQSKGLKFGTVRRLNVCERVLVC